jgi:hypothetical protein
MSEGLSGGREAKAKFVRTAHSFKQFLLCRVILNCWLTSCLYLPRLIPLEIVW